jgi:4-nitrophenyl phosphatase
LHNWKSIRAVILDMDGVLWLGDQPIGDLPGNFERIRQLGLKAILVTNNASRSAQFYQQKLRSFYVEIEDWQVITSGHALLYLLQKDHPQCKRVYLIGEQGLVQLLTQAGYEINEAGAQAVIVSLDRELTYEKVRLANRLVRGGAALIATNSDPTLPTPQGLDPGAGVMVGAVEIASSARAAIAGKPNPLAYQLAIDRLGVSPSETLVIGDRLATDIVGAQELGCRTALVLSGVCTLEDARQWSPALDLVAGDLGQVLEIISAD